MMKKILIILFILISTRVNSQTLEQRIDSLEKAIKEFKVQYDTIITYRKSVGNDSTYTIIKIIPKSERQLEGSINGIPISWINKMYSY